MNPFEAKFLERGPVFKKKRVRGLKAEGLAYEKKLVAALQELAPKALWHVPWFSYKESEDDRLRYCSPDILTMSPDGTVLIIEAKRSCLLSAYTKLQDLYLPIVQKAFPEGTNFRCVQVFRYLTKATLLAKPVAPLKKIFDADQPAIFGIHWIS